MSQDQAPSPTATAPTMDRSLRRDDYRNGTVTLHFTDAAHLLASLQYAKSIGKADELLLRLGTYICMAAGAAAPTKEQRAWPEGSGPSVGLALVANAIPHQFADLTEDGVIPARPGRDCTFRLSPDSLDSPSFYFEENLDGQRYMNGALIFWRDSATWSSHT